jgi:hypothetical protein
LQDPNDNFDDDVFFAQNNAEDIARVRAEGFEVNNDSDPAPENAPQLFDAPTVTDAGLYEGQTWGWIGINRRVMEGGNYNGPSFANGWLPTGKTYMDVFLHLFPVMWLTNVLVQRTNVGVVNAASKPLTFGELLRFIGMRLLMASSPGWLGRMSRREHVDLAQQMDLSRVGVLPAHAPPIWK